MNKQKESLRLILTTDMSNRMIGRVLSISHNTVKRYREQVIAKDLGWNEVCVMTDVDIEVLLKSPRYRLESKQMPDWSSINQEMQNRHVTLQLLWEEYRIANPGCAYSYSQFTYYYRQYLNKLDRSMRQTHRAGEIVFVDFAGRTITYTEPATAKECKVQIFIAVLGCSNYTFAFAVNSQSGTDWIEAHNQMFKFFGGVPQIVVPDNLKAAVIHAGGDLTLNRTYVELANHYSIAIVPTRVRRPKDKAKAEVGVLIVERWIVAKLRHRQFFSIEEINAAIAELLRELNERPFKKLPGCRRTRFEILDKPLLHPLPMEPFEYAEWTSPLKVGPDYHLNVYDHYYSVPHSLVGVRLEARVTNKVVEFFYQGRRVASHVRNQEIGGHTTLPAHQPKAHRCYAEQTPERIMAWANSIGPAAVAVIQHQFDSHAHPLLGVRTCARLQKIAKDYEPEQFEAACRRAQKIGSLTVKSIKSILQRRLADVDEQLPIQVNLPLHDNLRGPSYYANGGH